MCHPLAVSGATALAVGIVLQVLLVVRPAREWRSKVTPGTAVPAPAFVIERERTRWWHEETLIGQRLGWFFSAQGLLGTGFAWLRYRLAEARRTSPPMRCRAGDIVACAATNRTLWAWYAASRLY